MRRGGSGLTQRKVRARRGSMNPTTYTERRGNEVYVYVLGRLVMKR
jgi:hypothetical protein